MPRANQHQSGFTLIEMLVACGLVSVLAFGVMQFFSHLGQSQSASQSRQNATEELGVLADLVSEALNFRVHSSRDLSLAPADLRTAPFFAIGRCLFGLCAQARFPIFPSPTGIPVVASISNSCVADARGRAFNFSSVTNPCKLKCAAGRVPVVTIVGKNIKRFPPLKMSDALKAHDMVGASVCFDWRTTDGVRDDFVGVRVYGGFIGENGQVTAARRNISVPLVPLTGSMITIVR